MTKIGDRVILASMLTLSRYTGSIVAVEREDPKSSRPVVTVKLDCQDPEPLIHGVLAFDEKPWDTEIPAAFRQICWPEDWKEER